MEHGTGLLSTNAMYAVHEKSLQDYVSAPFHRYHGFPGGGRRNPGSGQLARTHIEQEQLFFTFFHHQSHLRAFGGAVYQDTRTHKGHIAAKRDRTCAERHQPPAAAAVSRGLKFFQAMVGRSPPPKSSTPVGMGPYPS
jgi:hypothetical protein